MPKHAHSHSDDHASVPTHKHPAAKTTQRLSVLAWPAWLRVAAVLPVVLALWLAVAWANMGVLTW